MNSALLNSVLARAWTQSGPWCARTSSPSCLGNLGTLLSQVTHSATHRPRHPGSSSGLLQLLQHHAGQRAGQAAAIGLHIHVSDCVVLDDCAEPAPSSTNLVDPACATKPG